MVDRLIPLQRLREAFQVHPIAALLGPRQCGKTTLARMFAATSEPFTFFDLEDPVDGHRDPGSRTASPLGRLSGIKDVTPG